MLDYCLIPNNCERSFYAKGILKESGISMEQVAAFVSIDRKKDEEGILWMSSHYGIPFVTYSAEELQQVEGTFHASEFVKSQVGVDNVCERAALRFSGPDGILMSGNADLSAAPVEVPSLHRAKMTTRVLYLRYLVWNDIRL